MRAIYFDCSGGAAGDMLLAAMIDTGLSFEEWKAKLALLPVEGYRIKMNNTVKRGISARQVIIEETEKQPSRHLPEIIEIIQKSPLSPEVKEKSISVFKILARAESTVHGVEENKVHFHEIGALDSIMDIVGSLIALEMLGAERIWASPLPLGQGWVKTSHGRIPVPAPATMEIIKEHAIPCYGIPVEGETVTPTGAALLAAVCSSFSPLPFMTIEKIGYGAGQKDFPHPNILRVYSGKAATIPAPCREQDLGHLLSEPLDILEANIDDLNPEIYEHVLERLFTAGALDVYFTPIQMKKNRPAVKITVLANPSDSPKLGEILLAETTTLGYRRSMVEKIMLPRKLIKVETPWGEVRVKLAGAPPHYTNIAPEYEDCLKIARKNNIPLKEVYRALWKLLDV